MAAKSEFLLCVNSHMTKIWIYIKKKTLSQRNFSNKFCLKVGEYEYLYIFIIELEKKNILFKNGGQNKICDIAQ